jgi:hypothetical protein
VERTIAPTLGKPENLDEGLATLAECCLGYLAAYQAWLATEDEGEHQNAFLWAGVLRGAGENVREASYRP